MNKIEKLLVSFIVVIMAIIGYATISKAADYTVGQSVTMTYAQYRDDPDLFCVEHHQNLRGTLTYKVISQVDIAGNVSTDHTGKSIESWHNAKLAYILSADNGADKQGGPVQNAIWNYMYTWMKNVGQYHAGLYDGFASTVTGNSSYLDSESSAYADEVQNIVGITDETNKENITVKTDETSIKVGPFKWYFSGTLSEVQVFDQDGNPIEGVTFSTYTGTTENQISVSEIPSDKDFYISIPIDSGISGISSITAKGSVDVKGVTIWFLESESGYNYQNLIARKHYTTPFEFEENFEYDIDMFGNLKVIKVNKDNHEIKLQGVGFIIQNKETGKYVHQDANGNITYVDESEATEFVTDENGEILIENLVVGTYIAYETKNPNYGYEIASEGVEYTVVVDKTEDFVIENEQVYVKLSGYVWLDRQAGKESLRNDLYHDDDNDSEDELLEGVIVRLIDRRTGEVVRNDNGEEFTATTHEIQTDDGILRYYLFEDVRIDELENYYIEFEYDGLTYTNVTPHIDVDNGSKAAENVEERSAFNRSFNTIEGTSETAGVALDENGNVAHELQYTKDTEQHTSTLINEGLPVGQYPITANTDETGYRIIDHFETGTEEIPYINLGLYEREQPDLALIKDMKNVRLAINGYQHIYEYEQRFQNQGEYGDGFNVGVKFGSEYDSQSYTRAIYKADYEYVNEEDASRELQVYVTYRIAVRNEATTLTSQINSIVDYFDSRYTMVAVGTGIDQEGIITGSIDYTQEAYNDEYARAVIYTNTRLEAQTQSDIYVQFELNREAVLNILNDGENLENVVEINSYSTFDENGEAYAGVDVDSNPGNATPGDRATYEDDTDSSPSLKLEVADAREIAGKVFLDSTSGELMTGQIRQGSGAYEEGETGISGVTVTLTENTGTGLTYTATTDDNGDFVISDFIPGDYTLTYTWGDTTYTVQNYKGTVYDKDRYDANVANKEWYKDDVETRWTDAVDDYNTRLQIDSELTEITSSTEATMTQMDSTTPTMGIGVEYETTYTASAGDRYVYRIENVDFGIVERARQEISLIKKVDSMRVMLANGSTLVDFTINEDGTLEGETSSVTYLPPSDNSSPRNGLVRLEMDSELIEGSQLEVTYAITAQNNSELDYLSENYYKYGIIEGETITLTPAAIVDYLDNDWSFNANDNPDWEVVEMDDSRLDLAEVVYNDPNSTINEKTILYTEALAGYDLQPTESATVTLDVSKMLSAAEDIELDNETEIVKVDKPGGSNITSTPGNYVPGTEPGDNTTGDPEDDTTGNPGNPIPGIETDYGKAETIIITPNTGENLNYMIPVTIGVVVCIILGVGIFFIKRKVLNK